MWAFLSWFIGAFAGHPPVRVRTSKPADLDAQAVARMPAPGRIHSFVLAPCALPPPPLLA
ncbi:hypothetical protein ACFO3A_11205 [Comamonas nitrativorans]|uniref:Uncharacterized protein n=1 Tax=Comamonas nitrativorans TaxID=108437 RepID=A0ABV9GZ01_9BURK